MSTVASPSSVSTSTPNLVTFARGTIATLNLWPALRIAVEEAWGGPESEQKRTWLASVIVDAFEEASNKNEILPDAIYVEDMLLQVMADEFDVVLEDGSAQRVSTDIVHLWQEVMNGGRSEGVVGLESLVEQLRGKKMMAQEKDASDEECRWDEEDDGKSESESESESDSESKSKSEDLPRPSDHSLKPRREESEVDEDGFTLVKGRRRR